MSKVGIIGLGDMGLGMARNLLRCGHQVVGFDLREPPLRVLEAAGGQGAASLAAVADGADAVFVMVVTGAQVYEVVCGANGVAKTMRPGSTVIVTSTVRDVDVQAIERPLSDRGIHLIDCPVSGGQFGADAGTLAMMPSCPTGVLEANRTLLEALSASITHVGETIGLGQATKASLQALIGSTFASLCEAMELGVKAGIRGSVLAEVFSASIVGSPLLHNTMKLILERRFSDSGAHIGTVYKDLGITMELARRNGVAMFTTSAAYEVMQATFATEPDGDVWAAARLLEKIAGIEIK